MTSALFLPWVPIILSVGVGARLLGRPRGGFLGICCALFWILLVQTGLGRDMWAHGGVALALLAGSVAIVGMGFWSSQDALPSLRSGPAPAELELDARPTRPPVESREDRRGELDSARTNFTPADAMSAFDDWLERNHGLPDPWPVFDEFIRGVLHQQCGASRISVLRFAPDMDTLSPMGRSEVGGAPSISARRGIIGHVATTGRTYYAIDPTQGELIHQLASQSAGEEGPLDWCFAVQQASKRVAVIAVDKLDPTPSRPRQHLETMASLISLFWTTLAESWRAARASQSDPLSGTLGRAAFLREAGACLEDAYREGEPVAVAAIQIEGLRRLDDAGRWDLADELIRGTAAMIRRKVRADDRLGRFDDGRFLLLLRRVDSELAALIVRQFMNKLTAYCESNRHLGADVRIRTGLAGSGNEATPLGALVARALSCAREARVQVVDLASDLAPVTVRNSQ